MSHLDRLKAQAAQASTAPARQPAPARQQTPPSTSGALVRRNDVQPPAAETSSAAPAVAGTKPEVLQPLTRELVTATLDRMRANYVIDDDGDVFGVWDNGYFYFYLLGEEAGGSIFQVYGQWERSLPESRYAEAVGLANDWNVDKAWPKAYVRRDDDEGIVDVFGEITVDFGPGITPAQLAQSIEGGLATTLAFFDAVEQRFPEAVPPDL